MKSPKPNLLFLMTDQMQAAVLRPGHPCRTPNFDRLAARGVRFERAYTPNAVCSPARASLMTGLLPHNHGVMEVTHVVDDDQCCLRTEHPHWAQRLERAGYRTGYFGKWHVERSGDLTRFGWQVNGASGGELYQAAARRAGAGHPREGVEPPLFRCDGPPGYADSVFYGVTPLPVPRRPLGVTTAMAESFLREETPGAEKPWCCFVSVPEPHDPFYTSREALDLYDIDKVKPPATLRDDLAGRPGLYRKAGAAWRGMTERQHREAAACYYASITEIDAAFGRLLDVLEERGELDNTVIVLTSDHGELLGAHGLYCKNFSAFEEVYNIPLVMAGPGIAVGQTSRARAGLHDLAPTLLECLGVEPMRHPDSRSFLPALRDPAAADVGFEQGYAEYHGGRYRITQRVVWDGPWKYIHNGFDEDELYHLESDPGETRNRLGDPECAAALDRLVRRMWTVVRETNDHALLNTNYPILRLAPRGSAGD